MSADAMTAPASAESDVELMRTILGEHVPQSVILTCLNACAFDVSAALNWYFAEVAAAASPAAAAAASASSAVAQRPAAADALPSIQSGLSLTLHPRAMEGMVSKSEAYYATLTRGDPAYDMLTPSNDKFLTIRLRKRGWRTGAFLGMPSPATQRPFFANGDVVTLECNGLWLKASSLNRMLQWKAPSEDDRNKFVIRGLPLGKNLAPGDYFFLTSYKWKDKEIVRRDERPVGISSYNTNVHRCFLGLERIKTANQRLYLYAKLTQNAVKSLPKLDDPVDVNHLTISVMGTPTSTGSITLREQNHSRRKDSISDEIQLTNAKIEQMANIIEAENERAEALTIQDFEMLSVLGKGSFGAVMLVRFKKDGRVFALKIIKKTNMDQADVQNAMEERQILQRIHHPYICGLVFAFQTNERLYLGMKYYAAGDLFYHLNMKGRLGVKDAKLYGAELVLAISYLHELNILYRDLKPSNVMIDSEGHIGVVDFGLSKQHIYGSSFGVKTLSGTAEYVAPEALAQSADGSRNYGKAYDWWSLGVVIYEMLVGESPFYDENEHKMLSRIAYSDVVFPSDFPRDAYDLVKGLLCKDPKQRLGSERMGGVDAIKRCKFFRHIDWDKLLRREVKAHWTPKLSGETDTRYVDPEFIDEGPPSAAYDPSAEASNSLSKRFSQFSFNYNLG
ncbi:AGC/AKT protein kinase [Phytophthora cinnamomi]|uniref:AGC/AKT protein kinase n=1 Tax=Phytophthora cinnamomi TaxID=4785 RepID=UPI00355AA5AC|nr:AGC/AKT protein kinase [Phytophthora cinnamomi]